MTLDLRRDIAQIEKRATDWHRVRFPEAQMEHVALKVCEEAGEVAKAINGVSGMNSATGGGEVGAEAADVIVSLVVLLGRWFPYVSLAAEIDKKLTMLETPGAHRASLEG